MRAGSLNKLITFEKQSVISDGMGGESVTWTNHASDVFAALWSVSAKEKLSASKETMTATHRIRIRYRSDIVPAMRIKYQTKYYNITSIINPDMANEMIDILATEAV